MRALSVVAVLFVTACVGAPPQPCTDCSGKCVDLTVDSTNCGAGGTVCGAGTVCRASSCVATCASSQQLCSTGCSDRMTDPKNCGTCNNACPSGQVCSGAVCQTSCAAGYSTCMVGGSDVCIDVTSDVKNCGMCGMACSAGQVCTMGQCGVQCTAGRTLCSPAGMPAFCASITTDSANCGGCGNACAQGSACNNGVCDAVCSSPLATCNADAGALPHYCANTSNDSNNCGACGNVCPAQQYCSGGACRSALAQSCAELQALLGGAGIDGPALLFLDGKSGFPFRATCADMDGGATIGTVFGARVLLPDGGFVLDGGFFVFTTDSGIILPGVEVGPKTYLDLPNQGGLANTSQYNNSGFGGFPPTLTNKWPKVRFDPSSRQVFVQDYRFVATSGIGGNMGQSNLHYGMAAACGGGGVSGAANIDLRGTRFSIHTGNVWAVNFSFNGFGGSGLSQFNQVATVSGGGSCGGFDLFSNPLGSYRLQLEHRPITCDTIRRGAPGATNGVYNLLDGTPYDGGMTGQPPLAYCDMAAGGFTLVMKIDGVSPTSRFFYEDPLWTSDAVYNGGVPDLARSEAKYATFNSVPFTDVRLVTFDGAAMSAPLQMNVPPQTSMHAVFSAGQYFTFPGPNVAQWTASLGGGTLEPTFCRMGFNATSAVAKVRLGILMNNEADCLSPDTYSGIGGQIPPGNCAPGRPTFKGWSAGSFGGPGCGPPTGNADKGMFVYVYVR